MNYQVNNINIDNAVLHAILNELIIVIIYI